MRASKLKPSLLESFVNRNANMPVSMRGGDAWRWFLSNTVGPGTEYEMESKWLDSYLPGNTYKSLRDKWAAVLGAFSLPGDMHGMRIFFTTASFMVAPTAITWKALYWAQPWGTGNVADGATVTAWQDISGNGYHAASTGTPTYTSALAGLNNRPAITFAGSEAFNSNDMFSVGGQPCTYVVITYVDAAAAVRTLVDAQTVFDTTRLSINASDAIQMLANTSTTAQTVTEGAGHLITATYNGASSFATYDGAVSTSVNPGAFYTTSGIRIGQAYNGAQKYSGKIALVGVYAGDITADSRWSYFKSWVATYYGLTIS